jgi:hypothetical protein
MNCCYGASELLLVTDYIGDNDYGNDNPKGCPSSRGDNRSNDCNEYQHIVEGIVHRRKKKLQLVGGFFEVRIFGPATLRR